MVSHWSSMCMTIRQSVASPSVFSFPDNNLSQWVFTKLGICIDILEILFGIANEQISLNFESYLPTTQ